MRVIYLWKILRGYFKAKRKISNLPSVCNSDMELVNEFNKHFANVDTAYAPRSISSRKHNHDRKKDKSFILTKISPDVAVVKFHKIRP